MKHFIKYLLLVALIVATASCWKGKQLLRYNSGVEQLQTDILGLNMIPVEASCFTFNAAPTGRPVENSTGETVQVFQRAFWISDATVGYDHWLWKQIMKDKPVSYDNIEVFLDALYTRTKVPFIVPSESMLEAAVNQGAVSLTDAVFVSDDWTDTVRPTELEVNWRYTSSTGSFKTMRERYKRLQVESYRRSRNYRFYLAVQSNEELPNRLVDLYDPSIVSMRPEDLIVDSKKTFTANGVSFNMMPVKGGKAVIGATAEQEKYADDDEKPAEEKTFDDFYIGETEVTIGLWQAVTGIVPSWNDPKFPNRPVVGVSWYDTKEFIEKLNALTGQRFRLPNEDEWEYAARGGIKTHKYVFAGSNSAKDVAVYTTEKSGSVVKEVKSKRPNELGLYDMSGNTWEWVQSIYEHPDGKEDNGYTCVLRGGSCSSRSAALRVSNRQPMRPGNIKDTFGFRLAL